MARTSKVVKWKWVVVDYLYRQQDGRCTLCGEKITEQTLYEVDHVLEKKNGGTDSLENLRLLHTICHRKRHGEQKIPIDSKISKQFKLNREQISKKSQFMMLSSIKQELLDNKCNMSKAAREIGISERMGRYYIQRYSLRPKEAAHWNLSQIGG